MTARNNTKLTGRPAELARIRAEKGTLLPMLKEQMLYDMDSIPGDRRMDLIHASELSHPDLCHRAVSHRILRNEKPHEPFVFARENVFAEGNEIHRKWQYRMRRTGRLWGQWRCRICNATEIGLEPGLTGCKYDCGHYWKYNEVPLYLPDRMLTGHADGAIDGLVVEIKSVGLGTLRYEAPALLAAHTHRRNGIEVIDLAGIWDSIRRPFPSHIRQGNLYSWMCFQLGYPFAELVFLYEFKPNQAVREFAVQPSRAIIDGMLDQAQVIQDAVTAGKLAACPSGGCKHCEDIDAGNNQENPQQHPGRPGQQPGPGTAPGPGHRRARRLDAPAPHGPAGDPPRHPGSAGQRTDGPVQEREPVAQVPADPAGSRRGRRVVRRSESTQSRGSITGPQPGEDSNADESRRPGRRRVHRSGSPAR